MLSRSLNLLSVHEFTRRLRCLSLAKIHSQRRWTCCYRTQRASCFAKWKLYSFFVRTFWFKYHLCWQVKILKVHLPLPVQEKWLYRWKVFLRILCVLRRVECYFLSIPSLWWFQLSQRYRLKCKRRTILWPFSSADMSSSVRAHWEHTLELVAELWKSRLCCEMRPYVGGSCIGVLWPSVSCGIVGWRLSIWFGCRYYTRLSQWKPPPDCLRVTNSERTRQSIELQHQICSIEAKYSGWCVITTALALHV